MVFLEISISRWEKFGFSNLNKKHYNIRLRYGNTEIRIMNIFFNKRKKNLLFDFYVKPTFIDRKIYGKNKIQKEVEYIDKDGNVKKSKFRKYYNVRILLEDISKYLEMLERANLLEKYKDRKTKRREIINDMILNHPFVKIWANDLSFLFQGAWHILNKFNSNLYKFPSGLKDKGIWLKIHGNFGVHLTKHLIGVFELLRKSVNYIEEKLWEEYKI